ncbi:MAG: hypothetical protein V9H69_10685, partial [Anaerolineae bacterium]
HEVTGRSAPDHLFLAVVYALLIAAPLAHVNGAALHRLLVTIRKQVRALAGLLTEPRAFSLWPVFAQHPGVGLTEPGGRYYPTHPQDRPEVQQGDAR